MTIFDKTTVLSLQNIHFHSDFIKVVWGFIPKSENILVEMKNNQMYETTSSPKWDFQTCLLFKSLSWKIKIYCHCGILQEMIYSQDKNTSVFKFQVGYMTHTMLKNIGQIENRLSRCFHPH